MLANRWVLGLLVFVTIFVTKLYTYFDAPLAAVCGVSGLLYLRGFEFFLPRNVAQMTGVLLSLLTYSLLISLLYGCDELIWPMKFGRTLLFYVLLYFFVRAVSVSYSYRDFVRIFVVCAFIHSLVIYSAIISPSFREVLYGITGYVPRGPEWSRSPGLTISFNATAIVHMAAIWYLTTDAELFPALLRIGLLTAILPSLFFLGKTVSYVGLTILLLYGLLAGSRRSRIIAGSVAGLLALLLLTNVRVENEDTVAGQITFNVYSFISPLQSIGQAEGVDSYFGDTLENHIYFSDDWKVLLFGDSQSGHIGFHAMDTGGETNSDMGVINSINANGAIATIVMYAFYLAIVWQSRRGDWRSVTFIVLLILANSFKETGFFESHSTQLLFIVFFYQIARHTGRHAENPRPAYYHGA